MLELNVSLFFFFFTLVVVIGVEAHVLLQNQPVLLRNSLAFLSNSLKIPRCPRLSVFNHTGQFSIFMKGMKITFHLLPFHPPVSLLTHFYQTWLISFSQTWGKVIPVIYSQHLSPFLEDFQNFVRRLPTFYALNTSAVQYFWKMDSGVQQRFQLLETNTQQLLSKAQRIVGKLFKLSKRCRTQPKISVPRER